MADAGGYRDIGGLMLELEQDPAEVTIAMYEWACRLAIALLHRTGKVHLPDEWLKLTDGFVIIADPLPDGRTRVQAVRRGEARSDSKRVQGDLQRLWHERYGVGDG